MKYINAKMSTPRAPLIKKPASSSVVQSEFSHTGLGGEKEKVQMGILRVVEMVLELKQDFLQFPTSC